MSLSSAARVTTPLSSDPAFDAVPGAGRPDTELLRSERAVDVHLAIAFFGWRWMVRSWSPMRYLAPSSMADAHAAQGMSVDATGTEPLEPAYWDRHTPWNNLPTVPHVTGSVTGARRLLHAINQMGFSSICICRNQEHVVQLFRETSTGTTKLAERSSPYEDEAIVQAALALVGPAVPKDAPLILRRPAPVPEEF
jgi:hypothetical protein